MKTRQLILSVAILTMVLSLSFMGCRKAPSVNDTDTSAATDNTLAEKTSNDATTMVQESSETGSTSSYRNGNENTLTTCATIKDTNKIITLTFSGGMCNDGHTRSGIMTIDYSQSGANIYPRNPGFTCVVSTSNYKVDGMPVTINKTITNTTPNLNPGTNLTWTDNASVSIVKSTGTLSWTSNKVLTLLNTSDQTVYHGQSTPITWSKAIIGLTGSESGTTATGVNFTVNVTNQLVCDRNCSPNALHPGHHPFINGTLDFTPGSKPTRHVNFGYPNNGACDDQALVTIGTYTVQIILP
jgi:hypothetical protein